MSSNEDCKKLCESLVARYESSKRGDDAEPKWTLNPFDMAYDFVNGGLKSIKENWSFDGSDEEICKSVLDYLSPLFIADGTVYESFPFPPRIIHDGFKVGTVSWVFMGRKHSNVEVLNTPKKSVYGGEKIYVVNRIVPSEIFKNIECNHPEIEPFVYCGYSLDKDIKVNIGPCISLDHIVDVINGDYSISIKTF